MADKNVTIQGLKGINDMSNEDYSVWVNSLPDKYKSSSNAQKQIIYHNQQFIDKFGEEAFDNMPKYKDRLAYFEQNAVNEAFNERYGDDKSDFEGINTTEAKKFLLENGYQTNKEQQEAYSSKLKLAEEISDASAFIPSGGVVPMNASAALETRAHSEYGRAQKNNSLMLENARSIELDAQKKNVSFQETTKNVEQFLLNEASNELISSPTVKVVDEIDSVFLSKDENGKYVFPEYASYTDNKELNLTTSQKIRLYSEYASFLEKAEEAKRAGNDEAFKEYSQLAFTLVKNTVNKNVYEKRDFWDRSKVNVNGVLVNAWSMVGALPSDIIGFWYDIAAIDGDEKDQKRALNFKLGLDEDGNQLPWYLSQQYFEDISTFNDLDFAEIERKKQLGLTSTGSHVREVGHEYDLFCKETFGDGIQMLGYAAPALVEFAIMKTCGPLVSKMTTKAATTALAKGSKATMKALETSGKVGKAAVKVGNYTLHALPMAMSEARSSFSQVREEMLSSDKFKDFVSDVNVLKTACREITGYDTIDEALEAEFPKGDVLLPEYDIEGNPTGSVNSAMNLRRQELIEAIQNKLADDFENAANIAATAAHNATFISHMIKQAPIDAFFKSYMYVNPLLGGARTAQGATSLPKKGWHYTKKLTGAVFGGGLDEFTDEMVNQGSQELGLNIGNSYLAKKYGTTDADMYLSNYVDMMQGQLGAYVSGAAGATVDPSTWQQAFVGALAPITNVTPKFGMFNPKTYKNWEKNGWLTSLNSIFYNPLLSEATSVYQERIEGNAALEIIHSIFSEHKEDFTNLARALSILNDVSNTQENSNTRENKDERTKLGLQHLINLQTLMDSEEGAALAQYYMNMLQEAANGEISAEEISTYIANNEKEFNGVTNIEDKTQRAKERLQKNAARLLAMHEQFNAARGMADSMLNRYSKDTRNQLAYMSVMGTDWKKRRAEMEKELGLPSNTTNTGVGILSGQGYNRKKEELEKQIKKIDDFVNSNKPKGVTAKSLKKKRKELETRLKNLDTDKETILSANEILGLNPYERVAMFENKSDYTYEQREEIEKAENLLMEKDANFKSKLWDIAMLGDNIAYNDEAIKYILSNPEKLEELTDRYESSFYKHRLDYIISQHTDMFEQEVTSSSLDSSLQTKLNKASERVLEELETRGIYDANGKLDAKKMRAIRNAREIVALSKTIKDAIVAQEGISEDNKLSLSRSISSIIGDAKTKKAALNNIKKALQNPADANALQTIETLKSVLALIEDAELQKLATTKTKKPIEKKDKQEKKEDKKEEEKKDQSKENEENKQESEQKPQEESKNKNNETPNSNDLTPVASESIDLQYDDETDHIISDNSEQTQIEEAKQSGGDVVEKIEELSSDTEEETPEQASNSEIANKSFFANPMYRYVIDKLKEKILALRHGEKDDDFLNRYFKWMDANDIKLQEIIDYELSDISQLNPDVNVVLVTDNVNNEDRVMVNVPLLVVKYTDQIGRIHKDTRGGVIEVNGEKYLTIGTLGYAKQQSEIQSAQFNSWKKWIERFNKFKQATYAANKSKNLEQQRFLLYADDNGKPMFTTKIKFISLGTIIRQLPNDGEVAVRDISELIEDPNRNPRGVKFENIPWMIQMLSKTALSKKLYNKIRGIRDVEFNSGNLFALIKGVDGTYVPITIKPAWLSDIKDNSTFKQKIYDLVYDLCDTDHKNRWNAAKKLREYINFDEENCILFGTDKIARITFKKEGVEQFSINIPADLNNSNKAQFVSKVFNNLFDINYRVQFNTSTITDSNLMKELNDAGCLKTDAALLGTACGYFTVNEVDDNGNAIDVQPVAVIENALPEDSESRTNSYLIDGKTYRRNDGDKYYDEHEQLVTDEKILTKIGYLKQIESETPPPSIKLKDGVYYIFDFNANNPVIVKVTDKNRNFNVLQGSEAQNVINAYNDNNRNEAAKKALENDDKETQQLSLFSDDDFTLDITDNSDTVIRLDEKGNIETTSQQEKKPVIRAKKNVNEIQEKTSNNLQKPNNLLTFAGILRSRNYRQRVKSVLTEKFGDEFFKKTQAEQEAILKSKEISTVGITNIDTWLAEINDCR